MSTKHSYLAVLALLLAGFTLTTHAQVNGVFRELYTGIGGSSVADLTSAPSFPNSPTETNIITDFFEAPTDFAETYGQRLRALILPPTTGNYIFWIASDDGSDLYLSWNEDPANKTRIANVSSWTSSREWTKEANQQSSSRLRRRTHQPPHPHATTGQPLGGGRIERQLQRAG